MRQCGAKGDAAAEADDADLFRVVVQEQRQVRHQLLGEHVASVGGVRLAIDRQRRGAGQFLHRHCGRGPLAVVEQRARLQLRCQIEVGRHIRRIHVDAAGQQLSIPGRAGRDQDRRRHRHGSTGQAQRQGFLGTAYDDEGGKDQATAGGPQCGLQSEPGDEPEAGGQRSRYRADGVDGVDPAETRCGGAGRVGRQRQRQRKCRAQARGGRHHERRSQQRALCQQFVEDAGRAGDLASDDHRDLVAGERVGPTGDQGRQ